MVIVIKSPPSTAEGKMAVQLAKNAAADIVLLQDGVYFGQGGRLEDFCGTAYALQEDIRLRGIGDGEFDPAIRRLSYEDLIDLLAGEDKVAGMF